MNLLSLILVFLALAVCASIAYIAWELTSEKPPRGGDEHPDEESAATDPAGKDDRKH